MKVVACRRMGGLSLLLWLTSLSLALAAKENSPSPAGKPQQLASLDQVPAGVAQSDWQSIRAAYEAGRYAFQPTGDGDWQARNPGQQWTTSFDQRGFLATPRDGGWTWGLELKSYGFGESRHLIDATPVVKAAGQGLSYQWDTTMQEWFVNDTRGLEHGFTVSHRPPGDGDQPLDFLISTRGTLTPRITGDAQAVTFQDAAGATVLNYTGLKVTDADGKILSAHFEPAADHGFRLLVDERKARYPITIDPIAQQAYLKAQAGIKNAGDFFGSSVAISGDTVVIGAPREDSGSTGVNSIPDESAGVSGAAYVFVRSGSTWTQQAYLKASNAGAGDNFGVSVAVSGDTVVVGASAEASSSTGINSTPDENASDAGAVYVFVRSGTTWSQQAYLKASNTGAADKFGASVSISGDTLVAGANREGSSTTGVNSTPDEGAANSGAAYVFVRSGSTWSQQAYLKASNTHTGDNFGYSVSISGDTAVISSPYQNSTEIQSGAAYVFVRSGGAWSQQAILKAPSPREHAMFGASVAVAGDTIVVGEPVQSIFAATTGNGFAYTYVRSGTAWNQQGVLAASNAQAGDNFGGSVAVSGDTVVVGASFEDSSTTGVNSTPDDGFLSAGAAYVFVRSGSTWSQQAYLKASNSGTSDLFGTSVALSGDTVIAGAFGEDSSSTGANGTVNDATPDSGAAYVFTHSGSTWSQQAFLKISSTSAGDNFGYAVAASGDTVVVGAKGEDGSGTGVDSLADEAASNSGAAYVFVRSGGTWSQQAYLKASNTGVDDQFGGAVAISGSTVVVGAFGEDSGTSGVNSTPNEAATDSGAAYVFVRNGTTWTQQAYIKASNPGAGDFFGRSVSVSGDTLVVSADGESSSTTGVNSTPDDNASHAGAAYVFVRSGTAWSQQAYLKASNTAANDQFGYSVGVSGDTVVVGAFGEDSSTTAVNSRPNDNAADSGAAYVFIRNGSTWTQQAYLKVSNTGAGDNLGWSVAISGDTVVLGAPAEDGSGTGVNSASNESAAGAGAAYIFARSGTVWSQEAYLKASNTGANDRFGYAVSVSGNTVAAGAPSEDSSIPGVNSPSDEGAVLSGAAYIFIRSGGTWSQQAYLKASNPQTNDNLGWSVAVSGDTAVAGAPFEDSSSAGVNTTPDENASNAGAAYMFNGLGLLGPPTVNNPVATNITQTSASLGGNVSNDGGLEITERGIVFSETATNPDPQLGGAGVTQLTSSGGMGSFAVAVGNLTTSTNYSFRAYTINSAGTSYSALAIFHPYTPAEIWRAGYFGSPDNSGNGADSADPDHDGVVNVLERAFNLNPTQAGVPVLSSGTGTSGLPLIRVVGTGAGTHLTVEFIRRKAATNSGLTYAPQFGSGLDAASWQPASGSLSVQSIDTEWERVTINDSLSGQVMRFGRVKVTASQ